MLYLVAQSCLTLCDPMGCSPPGSSVHGDSPGKNTRVGCHALLQEDLPNPGIEPRSPTLQADSLPSEPQGKPQSQNDVRTNIWTFDVLIDFTIFIDNSKRSHICIYEDYFQLFGLFF